MRQNEDVTGLLNWISSIDLIERNTYDCFKRHDRTQSISQQ